MLDRADRRLTRATRVPLVLLGVITAVAWLALARLGWAFFTEQLTWRYVAEQSRVDAPWYYRIAGVWGAMEGSLLLFGAILGLVAVVALRRPPITVGGTWFAVLTVGSVVAIDLFLASPFGRLDAPAVRGFGMNPILEHPAMTVHPPLLYLGLAAALAAALRAASAPTRPFAAARSCLLGVVGLLTLAMALGAAWSYLEQGWGGYWAWDPVENTSLLVWAAALVALHAGLVAGARVAMTCCLLPWVLALVGAILVRSGITPSIHGFAEQTSVGWALLAVAAVTITASVGVVIRTPPSATPSATPASGAPQWVFVVLGVAGGVVILAGTLLPVLAEVIGGRDSAVRGEFYSRTVGPMALVAVPFIAIRLRRWAGWSTVGHTGALVLLAGIAGSTFDRAATVAVPGAATVPAAGTTVTNLGVVVEPGPRAGTDAVVATVRVGDDVLRPSLVVYPERGGRLAEVGARTGPITDVQVLLESATDAGDVIVTVHVRRLMWLVWLGASTITVATLAMARPARGARWEPAVVTRRSKRPSTPRSPAPWRAGHDRR